MPLCFSSKLVISCIPHLDWDLNLAPMCVGSIYTRLCHYLIAVWWGQETCSVISLILIRFEPLKLKSLFQLSYLNLPSSGEDVPIAHCADDPPPTEVACEVACPADCVVGSWSSWSPCSHSCATKTAEGRQSRTRTVLAIPGKGNATSPVASCDLFRLINHLCFFLFVAVVVFLCRTSQMSQIPMFYLPMKYDFLKVALLETI